MTDTKDILTNLFVPEHTFDNRISKAIWVMSTDLVGQCKEEFRLDNTLALEDTLSIEGGLLTISCRIMLYLNAQ